MIDLAFGYRQLPEGVTTAWGARWIIDQEGRVDSVWDRVDACGEDEPKARLLEHLRENVRDIPNRKLSDMLFDYEVSTREDRDVVLFEDEVVRVVGSPQASAGYFYVSAFLLDEVSTSELTP